MAARRESIKALARAKDRKHRLREDCVRRVKEQREAILQHLRQQHGQEAGRAEAVRSALNGIISSSGGEAVGSSRLHSSGEPQALPEELSHEEYANLMSVLEAELLMEEDMLAREHQAAAIAAFEEACGMEAFADAMQAGQHLQEQQLMASSGTRPLLCPICETAHLVQTAHGHACGIVACRNHECALRLDCAAEGLTLEHVRASLANIMAEHAATGCPAKPVFQMKADFGAASLWMGCPGCGRMQMVI
eukprot:jgi/Tetstr1/456474/TSEL_043198.t1